MNRKAEPVAELSIKFGKSVTSNNAAEKIAIAVNRSIGFTQADKLLCRKKIEVSIRRDMNGQKQLGSMEDNETITGLADTGNNISFNRKAFKSSLQFESRHVDHATLLTFAGRKAIMTVLSVEDLPEPEKKPKAAKPGAPAPLNGQTELPLPLPLGEDTGSALPVARLGDFGLTDNQVDNLTAAMQKQGVALTVCGLENWIATNEYWHRDIKQFGPQTVDRLTGALMSLRMKHPKPTDEDAERAQRAKEAYAEGANAAMDGKPNKNPHPERSPEHDGWRRGYDETKSQPTAAKGKKLDAKASDGKVKAK